MADTGAPRHVAAGARGRKPAGLDERLPAILACLTLVALASLAAAILSRAAAIEAQGIASNAVAAAEESEAEVLRNRDNGYLSRAGICELNIVDDDRPPEAAPPAYCLDPEVAVNYSPLLCQRRPQYCVAQATTTTTAEAPTASGAAPAG